MWSVDNRCMALNTSGHVPEHPSWLPDRCGQGWACAFPTLSAAENSTDTSKEWTAFNWDIVQSPGQGVPCLPRENNQEAKKYVVVSMPDAPSKLPFKMGGATQCNDWSEASKQSTKAAQHTTHCIIRSQRQPRNQINLEADGVAYKFNLSS